MKLFLTGITGFLGRHVAELCHKEGHEVFALIRDKKINQSHFSFHVNISYGDITDLPTIPQDLNDAEIVVHCAADTNMISKKSPKQEEVNIRGLQNLIVVSKNAQIKKFIHISSANTIFDGNLENPADESIKNDVSDNRLPYINSKIIGEKILLEEFKANNFPVIILNPSFILGPMDFNKSSSKLIFSAMKKQIPFYPSGGKNIVDVRDVAKVVINTFEKGTLGQNYLLCHENWTYKEIFSLACDFASVRPPKYKMPLFLGVSFGFLGYLYEILTKKSLAINLKTIQLSTENHYYKADKAKIDLDFSPRSAYETIKDTVNWYDHEYLQNKNSNQ